MAWRTRSRAFDGEDQPGAARVVILNRALWSVDLAATGRSSEKPTDPATFIAVVVLISGVAMFASYLRGRRAALVDPTEALRAE